MTWTKYLGPIVVSTLLAVALFWWDLEPASAPAKTVTDEKQMAHYYALMTDRLFNIQLNGALRLLYRVNDDPELSAAGFQCILIHVLETTPEGTARSQWKLPFVESYLVPQGSDDLQWRPPNGETILFKNARTNRTSAVPGGGSWELSKLGPSTYNVYNGPGDSFSYENGCLFQITTRSGRHYRITTRGGLITKVAEVGQKNPERTLLAAEFDDLGHCTQVRFAGSLTEEFDWDAQGFLQEWKESSRRKIGFQYNDGLLVRATGPGNADFPIAWSENKGFVNHEESYGAPVFVKSAGTRNYLLSYSSHGGLITIKCPDETQNSTTLFNPEAHTIMQKFGREALLIDFRNDGIFRIQKVEVTGAAK
jgi:YD repeat-containing protein